MIAATPPEASPKLTDEQREELVALVEAGPLAAGYKSGVFTGPMLGDLIERRFGVRYPKHNAQCRRARSICFSRTPRRWTAAAWCTRAAPMVAQRSTAPSVSCRLALASLKYLRRIG